jgi:protein tyrosine/serine phosphatase
MADAGGSTGAAGRAQRPGLSDYLDFVFNDHAFLRLGFRNAHWISDEFVRSNQPWPHQLAAWRRRGIRTVLNLRGSADGGAQKIEREACAGLGLELVEFRVSSKEAPSRAQILEAKRLFEEMAYPALMHCKSGADRTGLMSVLYLHFRKGRPIADALDQLSLRYGHVKGGRPGVLDEVFARYRQDAEPAGISFLDWVSSPAYDPVAIQADYAKRMKRGWLTEGLLRRE